VIVPIEARGEVLGVLILSTEGDRGLDDDDLDLAVEIAHRAALAVGNARTFQQEHQIAETLQRALLPATVPVVAGLDVAVRYVAATDGASVGGDWYDVLAFDDDTTGLVVGDVVGHDIAASTSMGQLRTALRVYAWEERGRPATALARVDRLVDGLGLGCATCVLGVVDLAASTFTWSNAGHPPPLLLRDGQARFLDDGSGVLLGATAGAGAAEATTTLQEGDVLVLYTDGLVERRGESLHAGFERLALAAVEAGTDDAEVLCEALLEALVPASASRDDDVAILVARIRPQVGRPGVHRLAFEPKPESAGLTRGFTAGVLQGAGWAEQVDTAVLLVSELVTNAIRHACGPCALVVSFDGDLVELTVEDGDPRLPVARGNTGHDEDGRGLVLLGALAESWGVRPLAQGKATWFVLRGSPG
jgi:serine phosphatase RsbU (regulator of sigma subunit)/anti-sigma regulatory factor (Ser/Thr protein kinase)